MVSRRDLARLPKAHLHLHFTGSMRPQTVLDLAERHGVRLPQQLHASLGTGIDLHLSPDVRGWFRFQRLYDAARAVVRDESDMRRIVTEAAVDDEAEGSRWLELQIDPTSYARNVGGVTPALEIVLDEARAVNAKGGIQVAVVVAASRIRHPMDARTLARLAARYAGEGAGHVVGFGLSNDERSGWTENFAPAFRIARQAGLASVPHSGELLGADHVDVVMRSLAPDRLGHGVRSVEDAAVLARVVECGIALEVCPASNVALGVYASLRDVPLQRIVDAGATVALGADDPLLFGERLLPQYASARDDHGMSDSQLARLAASSIRASRADATSRARMLADVDAWLDKDPEDVVTESGPRVSVR